MDEKVTVEMTLAQYQDYLLLQVVRAAEEARRLKEELDAANARWEEAVQLTKTNGCTDEQLAAAGLPGSSVGTPVGDDSFGPTDGSQTAYSPQADDRGPFDSTSAGAPVPPRTQPEWSELKIKMHDNFFQPRDITVKVGDALAVSNLGMHTHNFSIEDTDIDVDVEPGETSSVELSALEPSTYTFVCAYHREEGMEGTITLT